MARLTIRTPTGAALKMEDHYPNEDAARHDLMEKYKVAMEKLAAYEDTCLEPNAVAAELRKLRRQVVRLRMAIVTRGQDNG